MGHCLWVGGDATDPTKWSVAANWSPAAVPANGDVVTIPAGSPAITDGLAQSGVKLDGFIVEDGYTEDIGSEIEDLEITLQSDDIIYAGTGTAYLDVAVDTITEVNPIITKCGAGATGVHGLQLTGSDFAAVHVSGSGKLGIGTKPGDTGTGVDEVNVTGAATVEIGPDVTDQATTGSPDVTITHEAALVEVLCDVSTVEALAGTYRQRACAWTTAHVHEATVYASGDGTHTTTHVDGRGAVYNNENLGERTFTNVTIEDGGTWIDSAGKGSYGSAVEFPTGMGRCTLDFGRSKKLTVASI